MNKTLIIGANGQIARLLIPKLVARGDHCVAMVRDKDQLSDMQSLEMDIVEADLEQDFSNAFEGCSKVVFSAGSGGKTGLDKTLLVDLWGARNAIEYAKQYEIQQFVMVSARGASNPDNGPEAIKPYCVAKHFADEYLMNSGLNYSILRPGRLLDEAATMGYTIERPSDPQLQVISREDTANAIAFALADVRACNKVFELYKGDQSLDEIAQQL